MRMTNMIERMGQGIVPLVLIAALVLPAQATTILVDLGTPPSFRGAAVPAGPDSNGNHWNSVWSGAFYPDLRDITGTATTVDFGFSSAGGTDSFNGPAGVTSIPPTPAEIAATDIDAGALGNLGGALQGAFDFYVNSTFQIQQLDLTKTYDITFFGSHKYNNDNTTRYTIYTDGSFSTPITSADLLVGVNENHNRDRTVTLSGVAPQPDGIIYVGFAGANGGSGYLNAFQIQEIPEPSSIALLLCALAGLVFRKVG